MYGIRESPDHCLVGTTGRYSYGAEADVLLQPDELPRGTRRCSTCLGRYDFFTVRYSV